MGNESSKCEPSWNSWITRQKERICCLEEIGSSEKVNEGKKIGGGKVH